MTCKLLSCSQVILRLYGRAKNLLNTFGEFVFGRVETTNGMIHKDGLNYPEASRTHFRRKVSCGIFSLTASEPLPPGSPSGDPEVGWCSATPTPACHIACPI